MRRQISLKSNTDTESMDVDATDISVKVGVHYPGRSGDPLEEKEKKNLRLTVIER